MPIVRVDEHAVRSMYSQVIKGFVKRHGVGGDDIDEAVDAYVSELSIEMPVRKSGGRRKMTDEEREERDRVRAEAKEKKSIDNAAKRAAAKEARDADKALWMTPTRLQDASGAQYQGKTGSWLRVQKNRQMGDYRKIKPDNWTEQADTVFTAFVERMTKKAAAGPDMSKKALAEVTAAKKADKKKLLAEKKAALLAKKAAKKKAVEEAKATKLAEKEVAKAVKLAEKEAAKAAKLAEKEAAKLVEMEAAKAAKLVEMEAAAAAAAAAEEDEMVVEDIELDDDEFDEDNEEMEDFSCDEFPGEELKIDENGFIYNSEEELVAVRDDDGNIDIQ